VKIFDYSQQLSRLDACRAEGFGFGEAMAVLDQMALENKDDYEKFHLIGHRKHCDIEIVQTPFMGAYREVGLEQAASVSRLVICDYLRQFITPNLAAVVEIGCGVGDVIVSLARDNLGTRTKFYATDLSSDALRCAKALAEFARADNLHTEALDIFNPSWNFLDGPALFFTCNVFSSMVQGDVERFLKTLPAGRLCAFEPCGPQLGQKALRIWSKDIPDSRNQCTWPEIKALTKAGHFTLERVVPDVTGKNAIYSLSLIQISRQPA
jgi:SAM-dependent methyltransferase